MTDDESMRTAAAMMALNGMKPRDIAERLNVREWQIRQWLRREPDDSPPPPEAA